MPTSAVGASKGGAARVGGTAGVEGGAGESEDTGALGVSEV